METTPRHARNLPVNFKQEGPGILQKPLATFSFMFSFMFAFSSTFSYWGVMH